MVSCVCVCVAGAPCGREWEGHFLCELLVQLGGWVTKGRDGWQEGWEGRLFRLGICLLAEKWEGE